MPFIVTGLRLAVGRGLIGMVLADLYTAISGIGYLIVRTATTYQVDKMFVPIVTLGLLGVTLDGVASSLGNQSRAMDRGQPGRLGERRVRKAKRAHRWKIDWCARFALRILQASSRKIKVW